MEPFMSDSFRIFVFFNVLYCWFQMYETLLDFKNITSAVFCMFVLYVNLLESGRGYVDYLDL